MLSCLLQHIDFVVFFLIIMLTLFVIPFVDLPLSKRRKGVANTVISTAFSAAFVGAAVGLTVYRMYVRFVYLLLSPKNSTNAHILNRWRDKGKPDDQEPATPPPPYEEQWTEPTNVKVRITTDSIGMPLRNFTLTTDAVLRFVL